MTVRKITTKTANMDITIYFGNDIYGNESYAVYLDDGEQILEGFYSHFTSFKVHLGKFVNDEQLNEVCKIVNAYLGSSAPERSFNV